MMDGLLSFITAAVGLVLSIAVLGLLYRRKQKQSNIISLVAYQSLGSKKGVAALQVGGDLLVVGVMPNNLRVLKTLAAGEVLENRDDLFQQKMARLRKLKEGLDE